MALRGKIAYVLVCGRQIYHAYAIVRNKINPHTECETLIFIRSEKYMIMDIKFKNGSCDHMTCLDVKTCKKVLY